VARFDWLNATGAGDYKRIGNLLGGVLLFAFYMYHHATNPVPDSFSVMLENHFWIIISTVPVFLSFFVLFPVMSAFLCSWVSSCCFQWCLRSCVPEFRRVCSCIVSVHCYVPVQLQGSRRVLSLRVKRQRVLGPAIWTTNTVGWLFNLFRLFINCYFCVYYLHLFYC
jgi:hypothetical protein